MTRFSSVVPLNPPRSNSDTANTPQYQRGVCGKILDMESCYGDPEKRAWVAALLEGEGCFTLTWKKSTNGGVYPGFRISCNMTDGDVLERLHKWAGGRLNDPRPVLNPNWKPVWRWDMHKRDDVYLLCSEILPLMGQRRSARIKELMDAYEAFGRVPWRHGTRQGYEFHKCHCELCRAANTNRHRSRRGRLRDQSLAS